MTYDKHKSVNIYVPLIGQYDNIGDVILRRELLQWLHSVGDVHAYVGGSPQGYDAAVGLSGRDTVYRDFGIWYRSMLASTKDSRTAYFFKPGELQSSFTGLKEHIGLLPAALAIRLRQGGVYRIGSGFRDTTKMWTIAILPSVWLSTCAFWRDSSTAIRLGGRLMPDLAFGQGSNTEVLREEGPRNVLVVSQRFDRAFPSTHWINVIRGVARSRGLQIVAVSQVRRDNDRTVELASALGGEPVSWGAASHLEQEHALRRIYRSAAAVVSDRLHVLIAGLTEGAVPLCNMYDSNGKIGRHMDAAGITGVVVPGASDTASICRAIDARSDRIHDLERSRTQLSVVRNEMTKSVTRRRAGVIENG